MKKTSLPKPITLLILTMITSVMWVGFSIYRAITEKPAPTVAEDISAPLNPSLDTNTLNKIESSLFFSESQVPAITALTPQASATPTLLPTPVPTVTPIATESATPAATPTETPTPAPTP